LLGYKRKSAALKRGTEQTTPALSALRKEPASFVAELRIAASVKWYELEMISQAKAAEIAGLSRAEFIKTLGRFGATPFQTTLDELIEESSDD
jgi:predicted HTH domain antitoxin